MVETSRTREDYGAEQLETQFQAYEHHMVAKGITENPYAPEVQARVMHFLSSNNEMAGILDSEPHKKLLSKERLLIGPVFVGTVKCGDGRQAAAIDGGNGRDWRSLAAEIGVMQRSDGLIVPASAYLTRSIAKHAVPDEEMLQIVKPHTSLHNPNHGCGKALKYQREGVIYEDDAVIGNLRIVGESTVPAITTVYNEARQARGMSPLRKVVVPLVSNTDDAGLIHGYGRDVPFASSTLSINNAGFIEAQLGEAFAFGSDHDTFTNRRLYVSFNERVMAVTEAILNDPKLAHIRGSIEEEFYRSHPDLTDKQQQALLWYFARRVGFQHLTGLPAQADNPTHRHAHHDEEAIVLSMHGKNPGQFDPEMQAFQLTPSTNARSRDPVCTILNIMDQIKPGERRYLYLSTPVSERDWREKNEFYITAQAELDALYLDLYKDNTVYAAVRSGQLIVVPTIVDEHSRKVYEVHDPTIHI